LSTANLYRPLGRRPFAVAHAASAGYYNRKNIIIFAVMALIILQLLAQVLFAAYDHNEEMYITSSVLARNGELYENFSFLQMPYLPLVYGAFFKVIGTSDYLLWGRIFVFIAMIFACIFMWLIAMSLTANQTVAMIAVILFSSNTVMLIGISESSNYIMPLALTLAGLHLFMIHAPQVVRGRANRWMIALSGVCLGLAIGTRLTYVFLLPAFMIFAWFYADVSGWTKRFKTVLLPLLAGMATALIPTIYLFVDNPKRFIFNNLGYHLANTTWRELTGFDQAMNVTEKIVFGITEILSKPGLLLILILLAYLTLLATKTRQSLFKIFDRERALIIALILCSIFAIFIPTPIFSQYFTIVIPFSILLAVSYYRVFPSASRRKVRNALIAVAGASVIAGLAQTTFEVYRSGAEPVPEQVDHVAQAISQALRGHRGKIATLSPLYAVEADLQIYNEFSTGVFAYRIGDLLNPEERHEFVTTSPDSLDELFDVDPPAAIFVRNIYDEALDGPFIDYAESRAYIQVKGQFDGGKLYVRQLTERWQN
jgi:hypothetical protein